MSSLPVILQDERFAELNWTGESWAVVLWESWSHEVSAGEQEFASLGNPDVNKYIEAWTKYGRVIF